MGKCKYNPLVTCAPGGCDGYCDLTARKCEVIDSVRAKKALECVEEIAKRFDEWLDPCDMGEDEIAEIVKLLEKYGFRHG